jgi:hypothetical protein
MQKLKNEIIGLVFELAAVSAFIAILYLITLFL